MEVELDQRVEAARTILKVLATGTIIASAIVAPNIPQVLLPLLSKATKKPAKYIKGGLLYSVRSGWIVTRETDNGIELAMTKRGLLHWQRIELEQPLSAKRWDGYWRLVMFDISNKQRNRRDALRLALKKLGFVQLQESVWITPYPCLKEIATIKNLYQLGPNVRLIEARTIDGDYNLKQKFNL